MAHPNLTGALNRTLLLAGMTAGALALPLGGAAFAAELDALDIEDMSVEELLEAGLEEEAAKKAAETSDPVDDVEEAVQETTSTTTETTASVKDAAEKVIKEATPAAPAPAPEEAAPAAPTDTQQASGSEPTPVSENRQDRSAEDKAASRPAPKFDANGPILPGLQSRTGSPSVQDFVPPPVVSAPFAFDLPQVAESFVSAEAPIAAGPDVAAEPTSMTATPVSNMVPDGVPGSLMATAAGLLLFVAGAHALHAYDRRYKTVAVEGTTTASV